ncbi:MAG: glycosyltransferase family 4 protein [Lactobacillales bacterium]|nr:glycosyltransferase family 4 protein [Lactobacillales bacterium]
MSSKMIVMQVLPTLQMGGVERGTIEIADFLKKSGIENYVVSAGGKMVAELDKIGVTHITLPVQTKNPIKMWLNSFKLSKIIREKKISLVHVRSRAPAWSVKWACKRAKIPFITTFHGLYGMQPNALKKIYNNVMTGGVLVIAISNFIKERLQRIYQVPAEKIRLIYRGADMAKFDPNKVTKQQEMDLIKKHAIPLEKPIITLVGRLSKKKGHSLLMDALMLMTHKEVTCLLIGGKATPEYERELAAQMALLDEKTTVQIISDYPNLPAAFYSLSDIVVAPTMLPEPFGRTVVEAQAMGRIVVGLNHGGAAETIQDGKTGFLAPVGNAQALADILDMIIDMPAGKRKRIESDSIKSAQENFSIQKMCAKTLEVYHEVVSKKKK